MLFFGSFFQQVFNALMFGLKNNFLNVCLLLLTFFTVTVPVILAMSTLTSLLFSQHQKLHCVILLLRQLVLYSRHYMSAIRNKLHNPSSLKDSQIVAELNYFRGNRTIRKSRLHFEQILRTHFKNTL